MHIEIERDDKSLITCAMCLKLSDTVLYFQVNTKQKWPVSNPYSSMDPIPDSKGWRHTEGVIIQGIKEEDESIWIQFIPDTEEENRFLQDAHRAHYSTRYGPSWFMILWPETADGVSTEEQLCYLNLREPGETHEM